MTDISSDTDEVIKKEYLLTFKSGATKKIPISLYRSHRSCISDSIKAEDRIRKDESEIIKDDIGVQIDRLYNLNATISGNYIGLKRQVSQKDIENINMILGDIIKRLRKAVDKDD